MRAGMHATGCTCKQCSRLEGMDAVNAVALRVLKLPQTSCQPIELVV